METGGAERGNHRVVVGDLDGVVETLVIFEDVRLAALDVGTIRSVVAFDVDLANRRVVVACFLDVFAVPVDFTTGPVNGSLGVAGLAGGPEGELHARGRLGKFITLSGLVPCRLLLQSALHITIDRPVDVVLLPVDLVGVPIFEGVAVIAINLGRVSVVVCTPLASCP